MIFFLTQQKDSPSVVADGLGTKQMDLPCVVFDGLLKTDGLILCC